jgi:hypothetical protein
MSKHISYIIREAGFSHTYERDRLFRLVELVVRECAQIASTAEPYKADELILKKFGLERETDR